VFKPDILYVETS